MVQLLSNQIIKQTTETTVLKALCVIGGVSALR